MINDFVPYASESDVLRIGGLEIENRVDRVTMTGNLVLTKDQNGLALAQDLHMLIERILAQLQADTALPEAVMLRSAKTVHNPFS